jgi:hypothetical protein
MTLFNHDYVRSPSTMHAPWRWPNPSWRWRWWRSSATSSRRSLWLWWHHRPLSPPHTRSRPMTWRGINNVHAFRRPLFWWVCNRPHVHCDGPIRLDHRLPDLRKNNLAIWSNQIITTLLYMRSNDLDMQEGLFDEFLHALENVSLSKKTYTEV